MERRRVLLNVVILVIAFGMAFGGEVCEAGQITAWGLNDHGQCTVPAPNEDFVAIAAGAYHSLGLKADGSVAAWGRNDYGQCTVPPPNADFVAIAAGAYHNLGLKSDGSVAAWGRNTDGQCDVPAPNEDFVAVAAGDHHSLGLKADGSIAAWGNNGDGQCDVLAPNADFVAVSAGSFYSLGLKTDGSIAAWGSNNNGQCDVPAPNADFVAVSAGSYYILGLKVDGSVVAWGSNTDGQCSVPSPNEDFVAVAACYLHSLGLKTKPMGTAFTYQGILSDANIPAEGVYDLRFSLYDSENIQQGNTLNIDDLDITDGYFTTTLDFGSGVFDGDARLLEVAVRLGESSDANDFAMLSPRQELTPTPYAMHSENADKLDSFDSSAFASSGHDHDSDYALISHIHDDRYYTETELQSSGSSSVHWDNLTSVPADIADGDDDTDTQLTEGQVDAYVANNGYGTVSSWVDIPDVPADIADGDDDTQLTEVQVDTYVSDNGYLSSGQSAGGDLGGTYPNPTVIGLSLPISETASSSSELLDISNTLSNDDTAAIFGMHDVTDWYGFGVVGQGGYVGTAGTVFPIGSGTYYGVWGEVNGGTGTNYGVYGYATGGATNYAGYFDGNVDVTGTLSKAAGSFKIDHPLDPENKYLNHSFVESPDMMNVYNGNVVLDNNGQAVVEMPGWFDALNRDCRYQITCIGGFAPVYIAQKIQNNTFKIAGGTAGLEVSWQVTGIRQDPYAEANRIQVEVDKPADERGKYLHVQAYGLEEGLSVGYEKKKHAETKWKKKKTSKNY